MAYPAVLLLIVAAAAHLVQSRFDEPDPIVPCSMETCFDLSKCSTSAKVYVYPVPEGHPAPTCDNVLRRDGDYYASCFVYALMSSGFEVTEDPSEACLLIPSLDATCSFNNCKEGDFDKLQASLHALPHWNGGLNHIILNYNNDWPSPGFDVGKAIVVRASWMKETYRPLFDVALPLTLPHFREPASKVVNLGFMASMAVADPEQLLKSIKQGRDLLLYFRGCVPRFPFEGMCEDRINIFGKYFPPPNRQRDIVVLALCCGDHTGDLTTLSYCVGCKDNMKNRSRLFSRSGKVSCTAPWPDVSFDDGMRRAKFAFAPRGCGSLSYRLLEAIGAGNVPILTGRGTFIPFDGEGSLGRLWQQCVVHVPLEQLPRMIVMLRKMSDDTYDKRLLACAKIAALQSHSVRVMAEQTACIVLSRVTAALRQQNGGAPPAWLGLETVTRHALNGLSQRTSGMPLNSRTLSGYCNRVGVQLLQHAQPKPET